MSTKKFLAPSIALVVAINAVTYLVAQGIWMLTDQNGADLVSAKWSNADSPITVYLVAGCGNQPEQAFEFIQDDLKGYNVINVNYRPDRGCDMKLIAQQVIDDIIENDRQRVLVIGCSIGDYVSRVCEAELGDRVYTIAINPEPDSKLLRPWAKVATRAGVPLARLVTFGFGWGLQWQGYSDCGNHFSWNFMMSQFRAIGYCHGAPQTSDNLLGIIIAEADENDKGADEFLKGKKAMQEYFGEEVPIYSAIGAGHGNTVKGADAYRVAWDQLWPGAKAMIEAE